MNLGLGTVLETASDSELALWSCPPTLLADRLVCNRLDKDWRATSSQAPSKDLSFVEKVDKVPWALATAVWCLRSASKPFLCDSIPDACRHPSARRAISFRDTHNRRVSPPSCRTEAGPIRSPIPQPALSNWSTTGSSSATFPEPLEAMAPIPHDIVSQKDGTTRAVHTGRAQDQHAEFYATDFVSPISVFGTRAPPSICFEANCVALEGVCLALQERQGTVSSVCLRSISRPTWAYSSPGCGSSSCESPKPTSWPCGSSCVMAQHGEQRQYAPRAHASKRDPRPVSEPTQQLMPQHTVRMGSKDGLPAPRCIGSEPLPDTLLCRARAQCSGPEGPHAAFGTCGSEHFVRSLLFGVRSTVLGMTLQACYAEHACGMDVRNNALQRLEPMARL